MRNAFHRRLGRVTEPQIPFPLTALCLLTAIWRTTLSVLKVRRADAEHAAQLAQGVETKEQAENLRLHACDELQGFYFKRPLPVDEFTQLA